MVVIAMIMSLLPLVANQMTLEFLVLKNTGLHFGHLKMQCESNVIWKKSSNMHQQKLMMKNAVLF